MSNTETYWNGVRNRVARLVSEDPALAGRVLENVVEKATNESQSVWFREAVEAELSKLADQQKRARDSESSQ